MFKRRARRAPELTDSQFAHVVALIQRQFGIELGEHKRESIARRLHQAFASTQGTSFDLFFTQALGANPDLGVLSELVDRASINHTYFWREPAHFKLFAEQVLPELERELQSHKDLRVWCAASATGEEPVTLAMLMLEHFRYKLGWRTGVLATDISASALAHARAGRWETPNVVRLPAVLRKHFAQSTDSKMELSSQVAAQLTWRRLNLVAGPFPFRQKIHVVFCRNVLFYFDQDTTEAVLDCIHDVLAPGGWLFLSHSETIGRSSIFEYVQPGVYRRRRP